MTRRQFERERERERESKPAAAPRGIPIGNLTSQLFANVYMNEFDQFVKHVLKVKHYARYTDDFVVVADDPVCLEDLLPRIRQFLKERLMLDLHPKKVAILKFHRGVDFLGYVALPHHRTVRTKTQKRIFKNLERLVARYRTGAISKERLEASLRSYLGVFSHADAKRLEEKLKNLVWF
ncbi:MAG: RNA-directed DNA polymerase [Patescibacteria group bacterium]|nr:RNA-directed DNA polymerase [Patescibacteria group bacterium]